MTSTLIKTTSPSASMFNLTRMESLSFKVLSILFIILINTTGLFSQKEVLTSKNRSFLYPTVRHQKNPTASHSNQTKVYTVLFAKKFPILENSIKQELLAKDDSETLDYATIFCIGTLQTTDLLKSETLAKNH